MNALEVFPLSLPSCMIHHTLGLFLDGLDIDLELGHISIGFGVGHCHLRSGHFEFIGQVFLIKNSQVQLTLKLLEFLDLHRGLLFCSLELGLGRLLLWLDSVLFRGSDIHILLEFFGLSLYHIYLCLELPDLFELVPNMDDQIVSYYL